MTKLSVAAAISVALSSMAVAPAAAQDARLEIPYGDLDLSTPAGSEALGERIEAGVKAVCERPDIRNLKSMAAWEQCKHAALNSAAEQLARQGAGVTLASAN